MKKNAECGMWNAECGMKVPSNFNNNSQITNIKQITMTEIQNPKLLVIGYWHLGFI